VPAVTVTVFKYHQKDWDEYLPLLMMAYMSAVHESTGYSACKMIFGREVNLPLDLEIGKPDIENQNFTNRSAYAQDLENKKCTKFCTSL
jgi:hypothetical protein